MHDFYLRDLLAVVDSLPADSAFARRIDPEGTAWGLNEQLLALLIDTVNLLRWELGGDSDRPLPEKIPRPGVGGQVDDDGDPFADDGSGVFRGEATSLDELNEWLGWVA